MKISPMRKDSDRVNIVVYIKRNENSTYKKELKVIKSTLS